MKQRFLELTEAQETRVLTPAEWIELANFFALLGLQWWTTDRERAALTLDELFAKAGEMHAKNIENLQSDIDADTEN